jgi:flagellar hook-length control protein FliK
LLEASGILADTLGKDHPKYARMLQQLVPLYQQLSRPDLADQMQREAARILTERQTDVEREAVALLKKQLDSGLRRF